MTLLTFLIYLMAPESLEQVVVFLQQVMELSLWVS